MTPPRSRPARLPDGAVRLLRLAWRQLRVSIPLAIAIALLVTTSVPSRIPMGRLFAINLVYALCIGLCIQLLIDGGRHAISAVLRSRRPDDPALRQGWPGWRWFAPWLVFSSFTGYLIGASLADALLDGRHIATVMGGNLRPLMFLAVLTLLASVLTSIGFIAWAEAQAERARAEALERLAAEHQLKLLESQLEPHMLFNTLANLRALIVLDPQRAQFMLDRLIAFLRGTLGGSLARTHALETEFARVDDYLALMSIRMGDRLRVTLDLPDDLRGVQVPPLILQPLVENAIRHGIEPSVQGGAIVVSARPDGDSQVRLTVLDTGVGLGPQARAGNDAAASGAPGFGTRQVRQRLVALYGTAACLHLEPGPGGPGAQATIRLPLKPLAERSTDPTTEGHPPRVKATT